MILYYMVGKSYKDDDMFEGGVSANFMLDPEDGTGMQERELSFKNPEDMDAIEKHFRTAIEPIQLESEQ